MKWMKERDLLIAQTKAFVQSVTGKMATDDARDALREVLIKPTAADKIAALREWADGRCLDAGNPGVFQRQDVATTSPARNVIRPSRN